MNVTEAQLRERFPWVHVLHPGQSWRGGGIVLVCEDEQSAPRDVYREKPSSDPGYSAEPLKMHGEEVFLQASLLKPVYIIKIGGDLVYREYEGRRVVVPVDMEPVVVARGAWHTSSRCYGLFRRRQNPLIDKEA